MTQTPPKPNIPKSLNANGRSTVSLPSSRSVSSGKAIAIETPLEEPKKAKANFWQNLSFRSKLAILLIFGSALPVIGVTLGIVKASQDAARNQLEESLRSQGTGFLNDYVLYLKYECVGQADVAAEAIEAAKIDLQNAQQVQTNRPLLESLLHKPVVEEMRVDSAKSFRAILNAQGKTIAQELYLQKDYPLGSDLSKLDNPIQSVSRPTGINLGDIPIVRAALRNQRSLSGVELVDSSVVQRLGLDRLTVGGNTSAEQEKKEQELVTLAVTPIKVNGKVVGATIVGQILSQNNLLVDTYASYYNSVVSLFAKDVQISTNIPNADGTRSLGLKASPDVVQTVLDNQKEFFAEQTLLGKPYLTYYIPIYDHQQELNPKEAKPIGMMFVGIDPQTLDANVNSILIWGYGIGFVFLVLAGAGAIWVAGTFARPIRRLQDFARQIARGEKVAGLADTERKDEIGVLSQELDRMAAKIEENVQAMRQEAASEQLLKEITLELSQYPQIANAFDVALEILRLDLNADRALFYRFDEETFEGKVVAESVADGWPRALKALFTDHCFKDQFVEPYRQGRVQATANIYEAGLTDCHIKILEPFAIKANLVVPVLRGSRRILTGLLCVNQCSAPRNWQQGEIQLVSQIATQFGLAIDRGNLIEKTRATADRAQALKDLTIKISQATDSKTIFNTAVTEIRAAIKSDRVIVYQFDRNWKGTVIAESVALGFPKALGAQITDPCFADNYVEKYKKGRVQPTSDIYNAGLTQCHLKQLEPFSVKANLVAPILRGEELLGLLIAHQCSGPRKWEPGEVDFFAQLATQVGLALERANLLEGQRLEKEKLQKRALELLQQVDPVSQGDLTIRASVTDDEIGTVADSYNSTVESLRKIVSQVKTSAKQMTVTTGQNEVSVRSLSEEAVRQAQEIADALERIQVMSKSIREVTTSAKQAEIAVQQAAQTVQAGDSAMNRTVDGILAIRETVVETSEKVKRLGESTQKISKVVGLIGRFAAQTHMLALKASIEAARAGDEGQGFAVIADEVRSLAAQSAEATAEISNLVSSIQTETNEVAAAMQSGTERVATGTKLVEETRQNLTQIAQVSDQINLLVKTIAKAAAEQSKASEIVSQTMNEVAAISTKTSTEATQVSDSFKELLTVAQTLQKSVGQFKVE
jgi:methyl-accepting chemotaxis protein PixJ